MDLNDLKKEYVSMYDTILEEHRNVFINQDIEALLQFIEEIKKANNIFVMGVGREGIAARSFAMRLMHLGKNVHWIWDDTTPGMHQGDLFITVNGSGNISHINCVMENAQHTGATIWVVTGSPSGKSTKIANGFLFVPAAVYNGVDEVVPSIQPMGNLFEQHLFLLFDITVMLLEKDLKLSHEQMSARHRNIE